MGHEHVWLGFLARHNELTAAQEGGCVDGGRQKTDHDRHRRRRCWSSSRQDKDVAQHWTWTPMLTKLEVQLNFQFCHLCFDRFHCPSPPLRQIELCYAMLQPLLPPTAPCHPLALSLNCYLSCADCKMQFALKTFAKLCIFFLFFD